MRVRLGNVGRPRDAAVQAHRQAEALVVDPLDRLDQFAGRPGRYVEQRAEPFLLQVLDRIDLDQCRRHEQPMIGHRHRLQPAIVDGIAVGHQLVIGRLIDHRADVRRRIAGIADRQQVHRTLQHVDHALGDVLLDQQQPQRRTALPGRSEGGRDYIRHHLFGQRRRIDDHRVDSARFRDQRQDRALLIRQQRMRDSAGGAGRAGESDALDAAIGGDRRANFRSAGDEDQHILRHAGGMRQLHRARGDPRRLRRRLGDHGVAGDERRRRLPQEDREREIPRRDRRPYAATIEVHHVALAGRPRQLDRLQVGARPGSIITAEIDGFAHFGKRIGDRFIRFLDAQRHQLVAVRFEQIAELFEHAGALVDGARGPFREGRVRTVDRFRHVHRFIGCHRPFGHQRVRRVDGLARLRQHRPVLKVEPSAVAPLGLEQVLGQWDRGMPCPAHRLHLLYWIGKQVLVAQPIVGELVDEARIGAVFQQAANQIGQQILMPADRRVDPRAIAMLAHQPLIQAIAHAVQPLELEIARIAGPFDDRRHRQRVVAGEGRADILRIEHVPGAGEIRNVGRRLAREQRIVVEPLDLRQLDLGIPIGPFDETHVHHAVQPIGPGDHWSGALAIGLHRHAEPVPALQRRQPGDGGDDVEAHLQPVLFLGIDGQRDATPRRLHRQRLQHLGQRGHALVILRHFVAGIERGELDRNRMPGGRIAPDGVDRLSVGIEVALRIGLRPRRFAQHVETGGEAAILGLPHALERFVDGPTHDEDFAHHSHRRAHALPDEWLAGARDQAAQRPGLPFADQRAADHQPPGRRIDQSGIGFAGVAAPIRLAQLVGDQEIRRLGIGHAQERFGKAQQRHAFGRAQLIFLQELVDPALVLRRAQIGEQTGGLPHHPVVRRRITRRTLDQRF